MPRGITLRALRRRLSELLPAEEGAPALRYRLPGESPDEGLVALSSDDDLALMMEEYDELQARAPQGGPASRLHVYCAPPALVAAGTPPSPRSVLLSWQAAAKQTRGGAGGNGGGMASMETSDVVQTQTQATSLRRKASRSPAPLSPDGSGGASASMLMLAEAVVANVLDQEDSPEAEAAQQLHAAARKLIWTPHTPARAPPVATLLSVEPALASVPTIAADDMELGPRLGDGTYAVVHAGWWRGASVAVKILRRSAAGGTNAAGYGRAVDAFAREAALLSRLQHPNVLSLYGVVAPTSPEVPPAAVLELMPHGSLTHALRARGGPPCLTTAASLALGAARAMQHLHAQSPPVIHFDLKADNLLVDWRDAAAPVCKLSDLGLACALTPAVVSAAHGRGTLWWMAPELFPNAPPHMAQRIGTPLDVFSFGIVLWEIATGGLEPYPLGTPAEAVMAAVRAGARPALPFPVDARWAALMGACWAGDPTARPSFDIVVRRLVSLLRD